VLCSPRLLVGLGHSVNEVLKVVVRFILLHCYVMALLVRATLCCVPSWQATEVVPASTDIEGGHWTVRAPTKVESQSGLIPLPVPLHTGHVQRLRV
jgi:hypothetical protein